MKFSKLIVLFSVLFALFSFSVNTSEAAIMPGVGTSDIIIINVDPETPEPNSTVNMDVNSYTVDIDIGRRALG